MFAERLREILEQRHITKAQLSRHIGVSRPVVGKWLENQISPSLNNVIKIASYLNVNLDYLMQRLGLKNTSTVKQQPAEPDEQPTVTALKPKLTNDEITTYVEQIFANLNC